VEWIIKNEGRLPMVDGRSKNTDPVAISSGIFLYAALPKFKTLEKLACKICYLISFIIFYFMFPAKNHH